MRTLTFLTFLIVTIILSGCGKKLPADWETTYPCTVKITRNGEPLEGAVVVLSRSERHGSWAVGGITDAGGTAEIHTSTAGFAQSGAPAGEYKVIVTKTLPPLMLTDEENAKLDYEQRTARAAELDALSAKRPPLVLPQYSAPDQSPLTIKVSPLGTTETFEVGK